MSDAPVMTDAEFDAIAAKHNGHDRVCRVETVAGTIVLRAPERKEIKVAQSRGLLNPQAPTFGDAVEYLARACVVVPERTAFSDLLDRWPLLYMVCAPGLLELAGLVTKEAQGK